MKGIGLIHTPFDTKFGAPKQGGLVRGDASEIVLNREFSADSVRGMKPGMFIWVLWEFHQCEGKHKELVRPPKLGGNEKLGVFATRSPFRPNNIGMSLLKLLEVGSREGRVVLKVSGADMVSSTPVLDIKPYHPKADVPWEEHPAAWFEKDNVIRKDVVFSTEALDSGEDSAFINLVKEVLSLDPRPAYHDDPERVYVNNLEGRSVSWRVGRDESIEVLKIEK